MFTTYHTGTNFCCLLDGMDDQQCVHSDGSIGNEQSAIGSGSPSPLKTLPGAAPNPPNPTPFSLNPVGAGEVADGAITVGAPVALVDAAAVCSPKENCGPDGAAGKVEGEENLNAGVAVATGAGTGAGAAIGAGTAASRAGVAAVAVGGAEGLADEVVAVDPDGCVKEALAADTESSPRISTRSRISAAKAT